SKYTTNTNEWLRTHLIELDPGHDMISLERPTLPAVAESANAERHYRLQKALFLTHLFRLRNERRSSFFAYKAHRNWSADAQISEPRFASFFGIIHVATVDEHRQTHRRSKLGQVQCSINIPFRREYNAVATLRQLIRVIDKFDLDI